MKGQYCATGWVKGLTAKRCRYHVMFSCISRFLSFGIMTGEEIDRVSKVWNAPFIGFFTYGEFGKSKTGKHEFHNNTCCVLVMKEK